MKPERPTEMECAAGVTSTHFALAALTRWALGALALAIGVIVAIGLGVIAAALFGGAP